MITIARTTTATDLKSAIGGLEVDVSGVGLMSSLRADQEQSTKYLLHTLARLRVSTVQPRRGKATGFIVQVQLTPFKLQSPR